MEGRQDVNLDRAIGPIGTNDPTNIVLEHGKTVA